MQTSAGAATIAIIAEILGNQSVSQSISQSQNGILHPFPTGTRMIIVSISLQGGVEPTDFTANDIGRGERSSPGSQSAPAGLPVRILASLPQKILQTPLPQLSRNGRAGDSRFLRFGVHSNPWRPIWTVVGRPIDPLASGGG